LITFGGEWEVMSNEEVRPIVTSKISGLTSAEALERQKRFGRNEIRQEKRKPWLIFVRKMWGPVPWMLEVSLILEIILGHGIEAIIIGLLVVFNAVISAVQENRAHNALELLRQRLVLMTRVLRDGIWQKMPAEEIVPGDTIYMRIGDVVPADARIIYGDILVDQSVLTGESIPREAGEKQVVFAGTTIKRGEATGEVVATGSNTSFGKTAELVRLASTTGGLQKVVFEVVRSMIILDVALVICILIYALIMRLAWGIIIPFALILLVASVPIALPSTFTLATALGALDLSKSGVLVTRLSAIEDAASMDVLCTDKTGTITDNHLVVGNVYPYPPFSREDALRLAAMTCTAATQDPLDIAILEAARQRGMLESLPTPKQIIPFDPSTRRSEAIFDNGDEPLLVIKGAPSTISQMVPAAKEDFNRQVEAQAAKGYRVLAIATGHQDNLSLAGLIGLEDPPRKDSSNLIGKLNDLGIRVIMITGDGLATAKAIAEKVGIGQHNCAGEMLHGQTGNLYKNCDVFAEVSPQDKYDLVRALQTGQHIAGMTGDGVNDAPALKQADVGIAVSNATDVAKAAASLVLTSPGLSNLVPAVEVSRKIYQRMLTYTLNKIVKTIVIAFFLTLGLIFTRTFVTTPLFMILLLFTNDFVTMSIATDRVGFSPKPDRWQINTLVVAAIGLALPILIFAFGIFWVGHSYLGLQLPALQTLLFLVLVFTGQATVYLVRERRHAWNSRPGKWMLISTTLDLIAVCLLATQGIFMTPISSPLVFVTLGLVVVYMALLDFLKVWIFKIFHLK
jgi:H+-transporting ATPase